MKNANSIKKDLLLGIKNIFDEQEFASMLTEADGKDFPFDVLTVMLDEFTSLGGDSVAELFFTEDITEADTCKLLFRSVITIAEDPDEDALERMNQAASLINFYVGAGAFGCDKDGNNMAFVSSLIIPVGNDTGVAMELLADNVMYILGTCSKYADYILMAGNNTLGIDELRAQL